MKKTFKPILILCCALITWTILNSSKATENQQQNIKEAILKIHAEIKTAAENLDSEALYQHVLDVNDVIIEDGALRLTRNEALDVTRQGLQGINDLSYTYNHKNIEIVSPTLALWTGTGTSAFTTQSGQYISIDFAETVVFTLRDGYWKILHAHRSSPNTN